MLFEQFNAVIKERFSVMCATGHLFTSSVNGKDLWYLYLNSFTPEHNPVFRDPSSSSYNCNRDKHFIHHYGNVVAIDDNMNLMTMWDVDVKGTEFEEPVEQMRSELLAAPINSVFYTTKRHITLAKYSQLQANQSSYQLGYKDTIKHYSQEELEKYESKPPNNPMWFHHFHVDLPSQFVLDTGDSLGSIYGEKNTTHELFLKGLSIPLETLEVIRDLMIQGSLLRADLYKDKVLQFIELKKQYEQQTNKANWSWKIFQDVPFARFANELIGTTCIELAEGEDINKVCSQFNKRVDPANYNKATAPITQRQLDQAATLVAKKGYEQSFVRRFATLDDIDINEIVHQNSDETEPNKTASLFADVKPTANVGMSRHKRAEFDAVEEVSIETFMSQIVPHSKTVQLLVENNLTNNFVAITTAEDKNSKLMFKWNNNYSWTYRNNLAGRSQLTEAVASRGGRVDGVFRFSHSWNRLERNQSLMDLHVFLPTHNKVGLHKKVHDLYGNNERIGWNHRTHQRTQARQDVDYIQAAPPGYVPVENITFPYLDKMPEGDYVCRIHNWEFRNTGGRGECEIACGGQLYQYIYPATANKEWVDVATATLKNGQWTVTHHLEPINVDTNVWNVDTNKFHKVNLICLSPNYWGDNSIGNKHFFFMLEGCVPDEPLRSFHIENLNGELLEIRKVLEVLGQTRLLQPTPKQLAGLGFTKDSTETVIVKVEGSFKRIIKVRF